jgi:CO dehydrogenase maturation factor
LNPDVADIADRYAVHYAGVDLLVLGAVPRAAGGCACAESVLLKTLVLHLVLEPGDVVILDMEAGIEHLGRGTAMGVDLMMAVVEPGQRSIETAHRVQEMAGALGVRRFGVVLNKATAPDEDRAWVAREFGDSALLGVIPWDSRIAAADRDGCSVVDLGQQDLLAPFRKLQLTLEKPGTGYVFPEKPGTGTAVHAAQKARLGTVEPVP